MRNAVLLAAMLGLSVVGRPSAAQTAAPPQTARAARDSLRAIVQALGVDSVGGVRVPVHFTPGSREHAVAVARLLSEAVAFYADSLDISLDLHAALLDSAQWVAFNARTGSRYPFGLPYVQRGLAVLPAGSGGAVAADYLALSDRLAPEVRGVLARRRLSYEAAVGTVVDLIGFHEVGHALAGAYGIRAPARWVNELLASYFGYAFMRARRPELAELWDMVAGETKAQAYRPTHRTLADFERLYAGVGVADYVWYQAEFIRRNRQLYDREGLGFLRKLRAHFPAATGGAGAPAPALTTAEVLQRLESISPGFLGWATVFEPR